MLWKQVVDNNEESRQSTATLFKHISERAHQSNHPSIRSARQSQSQYSLNPINQYHLTNHQPTMLPLLFLTLLLFSIFLSISVSASAILLARDDSNSIPQVSLSRHLRKPIYDKTFAPLPPGATPVMPNPVPGTPGPPPTETPSPPPAETPSPSLKPESSTVWVTSVTKAVVTPPPWSPEGQCMIM